MQLAYPSNQVVASSVTAIPTDADFQSLPNTNRVPGEIRTPDEQPESQRLLARQAATESNARSYPRKLPFALARGKGMYVQDVDGHVYYDCLSGAGAVALGHNHSVVQAAIREQLDAELPMLTLDLTTPVKDAFVHEILSLFPEEFARHARVQFCGPSGSDAVEAAIKLVKNATGRRGMMAFHGGYHGMTNGSLAMMGNLSSKGPVPNLMSEVHFLPYPYSYRPPMGGAAGAPDPTGSLCSQYIETILTDDESGIPKPAGIILEAVQGEGGKIPAPVEFLQELRRITLEQDIPLILDEVQTGLGRTGRMFAFEHAGIMPDVVVLSKAIGGTQPLAVVVYHERLDTWGPGAHAGTFRGNQLGMATGLATIKYIKENDLVGNAERMGALFQQELTALQARVQCLGDVRGRGLMLGMEIVNTFSGRTQAGQPERFGALAKQIQAECFRRGLLVELGGRQGSVVRLLPPLTITATQVHAVVAILEAAIDAAELAMLPSMGLSDN